MAVIAVAVGQNILIHHGLLSALIGMRSNPAIGHKNRHPLIQGPRRHVGTYPLAKLLSDVFIQGLLGKSGIVEDVAQTRRTQKIHLQMRQQIPQLQPTPVRTLHRLKIQHGHQGMGVGFRQWRWG